LNDRGDGAQGGVAAGTTEPLVDPFEVIHVEADDPYTVAAPTGAAQGVVAQREEPSPVVEAGEVVDE